MIAVITIGGATAFNSFHFHPEEKYADLWMGGDVNLGDGGRGQLQGISGIVQGAAGIVNLEGPVAERKQLSAAERRQPKTGGLRLWNATQALTEISALNVK